MVAMARPWRPDMNDVDRLSKGGAAKRRGTGSFHIPHRLNSDERPVYEAAKKKVGGANHSAGPHVPQQQQQQPQYVIHTPHPAVCVRLLVQGFLQVRGTGYRKGRKGHPLPNIYRQVRRPEPCTVAEFLGAYSCHTLYAALTRAHMLCCLSTGCLCVLAVV